MDKKLKEGISVQELENIGKKYKFEIFFILYFVVASLLTFLFFGSGWSICLAGVGGILGIWFPKKIGKMAAGCFHFVFKQEKATKIILAIVGIIISFFLPIVVFFILGLMGGKGIYCSASKVTKLHEEPHEEHHDEHHEDGGGQ